MEILRRRKSSVHPFLFFFFSFSTNQRYLSESTDIISSNFTAIGEVIFKVSSKQQIAKRKSGFESEKCTIYFCKIFKFTASYCICNSFVRKFCTCSATEKIDHNFVFTPMGILKDNYYPFSVRYINIVSLQIELMNMVL